MQSPPKLPVGLSPGDCGERCHRKAKKHGDIKNPQPPNVGRGKDDILSCCHKEHTKDQEIQQEKANTSYVGSSPFHGPCVACERPSTNLWGWKLALLRKGAFNNFRGPTLPAERGSCLVCFCHSPSPGCHSPKEKGGKPGLVVESRLSEAATSLRESHMLQ